MGADPRFYERRGPLDASQASALIGASLSGGAAAEICDVADPSTAVEGDLVFLTKGLETPRPAPGVVVIAPDEAVASSLEGVAAILLHSSPRAAFAKLAARLVRERRHDGDHMIHAGAYVDPSARIGPGAIVGQGAKIGPGADIGPGAIVGPGVSIGEDVRLGARAVVMCSMIGRSCEISAGAVIGEAGFGLAYEDGEVFTVPHLGRVRMEDEATLGANATVDRGMLLDTRIGRGARIDNLCHIAHNVDVGEYAVMAAFAGVSGSAMIGAGAQFGGRVGVADHLVIGAGARLAADAAVMRDVPAGETWAGSPAQPIQRFMRETAWVRRESSRKGRAKGETG